MATYSEVYHNLKNVIKDNTGMSISEILFEIKSNPAQKIDKVFCIEFQTDNSDKDRGSLRYRVSHDVFITFIKRVNEGKQELAYTEALDLEDKLIKCLSLQSNFPSYRMLYRESRRELSTTRENLLVSVRFNIEHSLELI